MFAFAEEDVLATAVEAPVEESATALEGEEDVQPIAKRSLDNTYILDVYLGYSVIEKLDDFDLNIPYHRSFQINLENSDGGKESFKSSNKKVAMVSSTGFVTLTGAGEAIITCTGKVGGKKKTTKFKIVVKDKTNPTEINGHFYQFEATGWDWGYDLIPYTDLGSEEMLENGKKYGKDYYIGMGFIQNDQPTLIYEPVPFNDDGKWIGPGVEPVPYGDGEYDFYTQAYVNGYLYKNSNAKVMFFDGNNHKPMTALRQLVDEYYEFTSPTDDPWAVAPENKPYKASSKFWTDNCENWFGDAVSNYYSEFPFNVLVPVFYKSGTNKLTIKTMATAGLKSYSYTNTFEIPKEKVVLRRGTDKELMERAKHSEVVLFQLDTLDIQSMDKVVLTIKVYNGTDWGIPVKDVVFEASVIDSCIMANNILAGEEALKTSPFLQYGVDMSAAGNTKRNVKVKGTVKAKKQSTITITFENHRDGDFNIKSLSGYLEDNPYVYSNKDALEILSPYPDVWDSRFALNIDTFYFKDTYGRHIVPTYAFGVSDWPINAPEY
jgi:hypothetical protein